MIVVMKNVMVLR